MGAIPPLGASRAPLEHAASGGQPSSRRARRASAYGRADRPLAATKLRVAKPSCPQKATKGALGAHSYLKGQDNSLLTPTGPLFNISGNYKTLKGAEQ